MWYHLAHVPAVCMPPVDMAQSLHSPCRAPPWFGTCNHHVTDGRANRAVLLPAVHPTPAQIFTLWVVIFEYWVLGLPLLIWLGKSHGVPGMWLALLTIAISEVG